MHTILIHGLGQTGNSWQEFISHSSYTYVCPDLYNYVQGNGCTYAQLYAGFAEYCNSFKGPINLCGISLGGILALNYAIQNPERVKTRRAHFLAVSYYLFSLFFH